MIETLKLCVSCKGCKRECPTGVDMARMKIEVLHRRARSHGLSLRDRLVAYLPRYAPWVSKLPWLANLRNALPPLARLGERLTGLSAERRLPQWSATPFRRGGESLGPEGGREVVLLGDSFNRYFEPENLRAALDVLLAAGYRVHLPQADDGARPLCCGRTFLSVGLVEEARAEAQRTLAALEAYAARGVPIVGLEPSCLLTLRDEFAALMPGAATERLASNAFLFEEFLAAEAEAGRLELALAPLAQKSALLHGHCHQKAFDAMGAVERVLALVPELEVESVASSCCGMAGAFGYQAETQEVSIRMAELSLLPAVRGAAAETLIVADGTSCRHQIERGSGRRAAHVARVLAAALPGRNGMELGT